MRVCAPRQGPLEAALCTIHFMLTGAIPYGTVITSKVRTWQASKQAAMVQCQRCGMAPLQLQLQLQLRHDPNKTTSLDAAGCTWQAEKAFGCST